MKAVPIPIEWHEDLPIFASHQYLAGVSDEYGWLGGIDSSGRLECILPYSVITKSIFRLIRFPVETILVNPLLTVTDERSFLNGAVRVFRALKADVIIPATFNSVFRTNPDGAIVAPYGSVVVDLSQSEETLWKGVHGKHRNVIKNAVKKEVTIESGIEYLPAAYELTRESFKRSAPGFVSRRRVESRMDYASFERQVLSFGSNVRVLVAQSKVGIQSAAVIPFSRHGAFYMHGGTIETPITGSSNLLQWEAMKVFKALHVRQYDFFGARVDPDEGSKAHGILKFKERFGGAFKRGVMWKCSFAPLKYSLYAIAASVRNGGDVVDQEKRRLSVKSVKQ